MFNVLFFQLFYGFENFQNKELFFFLLFNSKSIILEKKCIFLLRESRNAAEYSCSSMKLPFLSYFLNFDDSTSHVTWLRLSFQRFLFCFKRHKKECCTSKAMCLTFWFLSTITAVKVLSCSTFSLQIQYLKW